MIWIGIVTVLAAMGIGFILGVVVGGLNQVAKEADRKDNRWPPWGK